jgi:hypothetical protein
MMMLPTGVTQISDFNLKALLKFWSFVENKLCVEGREKLFCGFLFFVLFPIGLIWIFLKFLLTLFLPLLDFSAVVFALIFIQTLILKFLLNFSDFLLDLFAELWLFFFFLGFGFLLLIRPKMILFTIKMQPVVVKLLVGQLAVFYDFSDLLWSEAEKNVLWFEISVNDSADSVEEVQAHHDLPGDFLDQIEWQSFVIVPFENFEQINTQDFKHHTKVISIGTFVQERIQQVEDVRVISVESGLIGFIMMKSLDPLWIIGFVSDLLQNFYLIVRRFKIVRGTFHDFDGNIISMLEVLGKPDSRKVSPTKFLHKNVSVDKHLAHMARMVPSNLVVLNSLVFAVVLFVQMRDKLFQCAEIN